MATNITTITTGGNRVFYVVHPLFDVPEEKRSPDTLGPMSMTRSARYALLMLRFYLILMLLLTIYRVLVLAGAFG